MVDRELAEFSLPAGKAGIKNSEWGMGSPLIKGARGIEKTLLSSLIREELILLSPSSRGPASM